MAFEKYTLRRSRASNPVRVTVERGGRINVLVGALAQLAFQPRSADLYFDKDTNEVAIDFHTSDPPSDLSGHTVSVQDTGCASIYPKRFLRDYRIRRGQNKIPAIYRQVNNKNMLVFPVEVEAPND